MTREQLYRIFVEPVDPAIRARMRGFMFGYAFKTSPYESDHLNPEFVRGWHEGIDLLFDERRAEGK